MILALPLIIVALLALVAGGDAARTPAQSLASALRLHALRHARTSRDETSRAER